MSVTIEFQNGAPIVRGITAAEDFSLQLFPQQTSTGTGSPSTLNDANTLLLNGVQIDNTFSVQNTDSPVEPTGLTITNLTPSVATFTDGAPSTWVSNGIARVQADHATLGTKIASIPVTRTLSGSGESFVSYIAGSLAGDLFTMVDNVTSITTASPDNVPMFVPQGSNNRNSNLWMHTLADVTAITRERGGLFSNAPLISAHHILTAAHTNPTIGITLVWSDNSKRGYAGTIAAVATVSGTDIAICYIRDATAGEMTAYNAANPGSTPVSLALSAASPAFTSTALIKPMAMFPSTVWQAGSAGTSPLPLAPSVQALINSLWVPTFHTTRNYCVGTWDIGITPRTDGLFGITPSAETDENQFTQSSLVGITASADITFTAIPVSTTLSANNSTLGAKYPILLGTTYARLGSSFAMPWLPLYLTQITTAMQATAQTAGDPSYASYAPTTVSLSGYTSY